MTDTTAPAAPDSGDDPCPFCPIPPAVTILREWRGKGLYAAAFEPLNPVTPGHVLIVPGPHVEDVAENAWLTADLFRCVAQYVADMGGDCNVITSKGPAATQTVKHLHVHVVPRRDGDGLPLPWTPQQVRAALSGGDTPEHAEGRACSCPEWEPWMGEAQPGPDPECPWHGRSKRRRPASPDPEKGQQ